MKLPAAPGLICHHFNSMGCPAKIEVYANSSAYAREAIAGAESEVHRLDRKYSHYCRDSELEHILRRASRTCGVAVDEETAALLDFAATQHRVSAGYFDITAGRLTALWDRAQSVPQANQISSALALTGWHRLNWDGKTLRVPPGMRLDLGGIVKEYAADRAALKLKSAGIESGYVDLGGDLHFLGPHPDGNAWRCGVRNPRGAGAVAAMSIVRGGLATSGDYERCLEVGGQRFSHIINPFTGWPVQGLASVTVVAATCVLAGAVSTLAMLQGRDQGLEFLSGCGLPWTAHDGLYSYPSSQGTQPAPGPSNPHLPPRKVQHASIPIPNPIQTRNFTPRFTGSSCNRFTSTGG